jgi:hypothetical protein
MSQNPYAQSADFAPPPESRTSVLAIISLVCSLICIVPGLGLIGTILGISALFGISRSQGAVRGNGLAVSGIVLGLIVTVLWICGLIGAAQVNQMFGKAFIGPVGNVVQAIEAGDYKTARQSFDPALNAAVTDEQIKAFADAYQAELGHYKSMPQSLMEMFGAYSKVGPQFQNYQGRGTPGEVPLPAAFDKGDSLILIQMPTNGRQQQPTAGNWVPSISNLGVLTPAGKEIWLLPLPGSAPTQPGDPDAPAPPSGGG